MSFSRNHRRKRVSDGFEQLWLDRARAVEQLLGNIHMSSLGTPAIASTVTTIQDQSAVDAANREYWDSLCGSSLAQFLGIHDFSLASLVKFDAYYFGYYPYLLKHVRPDLLWGKRILEVGLGYGSLAQVLAAAGDYTGMDIAAGPVALVERRLAMNGLPGRACQASILESTLDSSSFDAVVTIGCLHHTGALERAIQEIHRLLRPGGRLVFMVYNAYSYRRWLMFTRPTARAFSSEYFGLAARRKASREERAAYDGGEGDAAAPETEFFSSRQLQKLLRVGFCDVKVSKENATPESRFSGWTRERMLQRIAPRFGLDLYVQATKAA
jgi:SAM-dependent methyltransferase